MISIRKKRKTFNCYFEDNYVFGAVTSMMRIAKLLFLKINVFFSHSLWNRLETEHGQLPTESVLALAKSKTGNRAGKASV